MVSNLGLSHLIQISIPVLTAIYPPHRARVLSFTCVGGTARRVSSRR